MNDDPYQGLGKPKNAEEWFALYWPDRKAAKFMFGYMDLYAKWVLREFAQAVAEKIKLAHIKGDDLYSKYYNTGMTDAVSLLLREAGIEEADDSGKTCNFNCACHDKVERIQPKPHPEYGPCDGIANGQCAECIRQGVVERVQPEAPAVIDSIRLILQKIVADARNTNEPGGTWVLVAGGLIDEAEEVLK